MFKVRRVSRKLSAKSQKLIVNLLPQLSFDKQKLNDYERIHFEVGFGTGDHILKQASLNPNDLFIGCEPYMNGVAALLTKIEEHDIKNISIHNHDAKELLDIFDNGLLSYVYILFPDPWPKIRHHKRRFINQNMLLTLHNKLKSAGNLSIATDDENYASAIEQAILATNLFEKINTDITVETKYSKRAVDMNHIIQYFYLKKLSFCY